LGDTKKGIELAASRMDWRDQKPWTAYGGDTVKEDIKALIKGIESVISSFFFWYSLGNLIRGIVLWSCIWGVCQDGRNSCNHQTSAEKEDTAEGTPLIQFFFLFIKQW
jgi:hypothetical protein